MCKELKEEIYKQYLKTSNPRPPLPEWFIKLKSFPAIFYIITLLTTFILGYSDCYEVKFKREKNHILQCIFNYN